MLKRAHPKLTYANLTATLALFIALGGSAMGAVIVTSNSQVAKGTISGHHPPSGDHANLIAGSLTGKDVHNNSLTGTQINSSTLGKVPSAADADTVGGNPASSLGGVLTGRMDSLTTSSTAATDYGSLSGISTAQSAPDSLWTLSPNRNLTLRDFSVQLTHTSDAGLRTFKVVVSQNGTTTATTLCTPFSAEVACNSGSTTVSIPANSLISIAETTNPITGGPTAADATFGLRLTP